MAFLLRRSSTEAFETELKKTLLLRRSSTASSTRSTQTYREISAGYITKLQPSSLSSIDEYFSSHSGHLPRPTLST